MVPAWALAEDASPNSGKPTTEEVKDPESALQNNDETGNAGNASNNVVPVSGTGDGMATDELQAPQGPVVVMDDANSANTQNDAQDAVEQDALVTADEEAASSEATQKDKAEVKPEATTADAHVVYSGHVENKGWLPEVRDGESAGTEGQSLRVEALRIKLDLANTGLNGGIEYRMHVQNVGWTGWVRDGADGGTTGLSRRVEAMQLRLYGSVADKYTVRYCVHAQNVGWMAWANEGESAGTAGQSYRLESVKIKLVPVDGAQPLDTSFINYNKSFYGGKMLSVQSHVQNVGWQKEVGNGETSGTTGRSLRIESLKVHATGLDVPGSVQIAGHIQDIGWTGWKDGTVGTTGRSKRLEAIRIQLVGEEAINKYDIYYRVHVSNIGWMGWACNGAEAGTSGMSLRIEALQVLLVSKGEVPSNDGSATTEAYITGADIVYRAHNQDTGWGGYTANGRTAGVTGQSKRMEAFDVALSGGNVGGSVQYRAYVAGSGWQDFKNPSDVAGTIGASKGVEAIQVRLTGRAAQTYNVYYRTHVSSAGWLGWARNGETAGAPGTGRNVEAIQIRLESKNSGAPGSTEDHQVNKEYFEDALLRKAQGYSSPTGWIIMVDTNKCQLGVYHGSKGSWSRSGKWTISCGAPSSPSVKGVFSVSGRGYAFGYGHGYTCYWWVSWNGPYLFHSIKYDEGTFNVQDGRLGKHISAGCIRMPIERAKWIYDHIPDGTTVVTF